MNTLFIFFLLATFLAITVDASNANPVSNDLECTVCNYVVGWMDEMLQQNKTEVEIMDFVKNDLCPLLPSAYKATCDGIVTAYGVTILQALANKENPTTVCQTQTHLCPSELDGGIIDDVKCALECGIEGYDALKDCMEAYNQALIDVLSDFECGKALWKLASRCGKCVYDQIEHK